MTARSRPPGGATKRPRRPLRQRRRRDTVRAEEVVADALAFAGLTEVVRAHRIITEWREMVGERIAARTWPDGLKNGVLSIRVASSAWLHELTLLRQQILDGIDRVLGAPRLVDEIKLHIGLRKQVDADDMIALAQQARRRRHRPPARPLPPPATGAVRERIERESAAVADPELAALIAAVRIKHDR